FVLSLLHKPKVLFLDEPTIGLDVVVKKNIRELIKKINKEEKVTVILTSHDMGDVETICKRAIIINHGKIIYDGNISDIKKKYMKKKIIKMVSDTPVKEISQDGVDVLKKTKFSLDIEVDTTKTTMKKIIDLLAKNNDINDLTIEEEPIEEIIETIFKQ
ncbi:AAA family ATPase, partial [Candidatus Woesearchaeota archaeon]|nr:AAA family ATPase [Candidatus Woesearchaeota archaeon]